MDMLALLAWFACLPVVPARIFMCDSSVVPRGVAYLDTWLKYPEVHDYTLANGETCLLPPDASPCDVAATLTSFTCTSDKDAVNIVADRFPLLIARSDTLQFPAIWAPTFVDILLLLAVAVTMSLFVLVSLADIFGQDQTQPQRADV